ARPWSVDSPAAHVVARVPPCRGASPPSPVHETLLLEDRRDGLVVRAFDEVGGRKTEESEALQGRRAELMSQPPRRFRGAAPALCRHWVGPAGPCPTTPAQRAKGQKLGPRRRDAEHREAL